MILLTCFNSSLELLSTAGSPFLMFSISHILSEFVNLATYPLHMTQSQCYIIYCGMKSWGGFEFSCLWLNETLG